MTENKFFIVKRTVALEFTLSIMSRYTSLKEECFKGTY